MKIIISIYLILFGLFNVIIFSCEKVKCNSYDLNFKINGKDVANIIYGIPSLEDSVLCYIANLGDELLIEVSKECNKLIWKIDGKEVIISDGHIPAFNNSGIHKIELHNLESDQFIRKYIFIRDLLSSNNLEMHTVSPEAKKIEQLERNTKHYKCNSIKFYVSETEGTIYDLPSGIYSIEINEDGKENRYTIRSDGKEVSFNWNKRHYPSPKNYVARIKNSNILICQIKQSN